MTQEPRMYLISTVAQTLDMHPQTLRKYERAGFVVPPRVGPLRTYSDEDIARLRLVKHFVGDLGLNMAGVQMALNFTGDLLGLRTTLASAPGISEEAAESVCRIDGMLASLGVRVVVERSKGEDVNRSSVTPGNWFGTRPGESLEFNKPDVQARSHG